MREYEIWGKSVIRSPGVRKRTSGPNRGNAGRPSKTEACEYSPKIHPNSFLKKGGGAGAGESPGSVNEKRSKARVLFYPPIRIHSSSFDGEERRVRRGERRERFQRDAEETGEES